MPRKRKAPDPAAEEARKRRKAEAERQRRAARGEEGRRAATEAQRQRRARRGEEGRRAEAEAKRRERARRGDEGRRAATEAQRRRRARLGEEGRRAEAEAKRKERANRTEERRAAEVAAKRRRRAERRKQQRDAEDSASSDFNTSFDDYPCSASCDVCHRLWFKLDVSNVQKEWLPLLLLEFPGEDVASFKVCPSCRSSLSSNKVPSLSRSNDFIQPPMPAHLPQLNLVEERLVPPRTPFLQESTMASTLTGVHLKREKIEEEETPWEQQEQLLPSEAEVILPDVPTVINHPVLIKTEKPEVFGCPPSPHQSFTR